MEPPDLDILAWKIPDWAPGFRVVGEHRSHLYRSLDVTDPISHRTVRIAFDTFLENDSPYPTTFSVHVYGDLARLERMHQRTPPRSDGTPYVVRSMRYAFPYAVCTRNDDGAGELFISSVPWEEISLIGALFKQLISDYLFQYSAGE